MKPRAVLFLLLAVASLGAVLLLSDRAGLSTEDRALRRDRAFGLADAAADGVAAIELRRSGSPIVRLERGAPGTEGDAWPWWVVDPTASLKRRADRTEVEELLERLVGLRVVRVLDESAGGSPPIGEEPIDIALQSEDGERTVRLGDAVPLDGGVLAERDGTMLVVEADAAWRATLGRAAASWLDPRVFAVERSEIDRIVLLPGPDDGEAATIELVRIEGPGERFRIVRPIEGPADSEAIAGLLFAIAGLERQRDPLGPDGPWPGATLPGETPLGEDGSRPASPDPTGDRSGALDFEVGSTLYWLRVGDGWAQFAREGETAETVTAEPESLFTMLSVLGLSPEEWLALDLFDVEVFDVDRVALRDDEGLVELERVDGIWRVSGAGTPVAPGPVADLLYPLMDLRARSWSGEGKPEGAHPLLTATVSVAAASGPATTGTHQIELTIYPEERIGRSVRPILAFVETRDGAFLLDSTDVGEIVRRLAAIRAVSNRIEETNS